MRNTTEKQERRALSIHETAQACGLSRATIYRLIEKKLTTLKVGARRLVSVGAITRAPAEAAARGARSFALSPIGAGRPADLAAPPSSGGPQGRLCLLIRTKIEDWPVQNKGWLREFKRIAPATRRALLLHFAQAAANRLHRLTDPAAIPEF
jgi:hypothetical protein